MKTIKRKVMKFSFSAIMLIMMQVILTAQTVIISPTGDGGFENGTSLAANGWTGISGTNGNWYFNTAAISNNSYTFTPTGTRSLYFSDNSGTNWQYQPDANPGGCAHFYRNVTFPAGQTNIDLSFRWNANGESSWDILYVYLCPTTLTPVTNSPSGSSSVPTWSGTGTAELIGSCNLLSAGSGTTSNFAIPASYAGGTYRLVFSWKNDGLWGDEPPIAIDQISLTSSTPSVPNDAPCGAIAITPGNCTPTQGDVLGATQSYAGCAGTANDDVWFSFVATSTSHEIIVTPSADFDAVWQLYTGACGAPTGTAICVDDYIEGGAESTIVTGFTVGTTYYIRVYDYYSGYPATSTFTITVDKPYLLNATINNTTITQCCTKLYDSGGPSADYSQNENYTVTYQAGAGQRIRMTVWEFATQASTDYLYIYDGPNTSSPLLFTWSGTPSYIPDAVSSGQYLTVRFTSNNNSQTTGFVADLKCENIPPPPGNCNGNTPASDYCSSATQICDPNGYCGNTSSFYTPDLPGNMCNSTGCTLFGGSIENNSWISFTAAATTATLQFNVSNCSNGWGIQFGIYSGSNCTGFVLLTDISKTTDAQLGSQTITATGLTIGSTYYIMVDGFAGDVCNYTIDVLAGAMEGNITGTTPVCYGQTGVTYTMNALATGYSWTVPAGATITSGTGTNTITVNWGTASSGNVTCAATAGACAGASDSYAVTVTPTVGTPSFTLGATSTRCQGAGSVTYTASATNTTGITYTLDAASIAGGVTIVAGTGAVTYPAGWSGTTTVTASAAGCNGPRTATHTVTITPTVGTPSFTLGATSTRCQGAGSVTYTASATNTTGITYTLDAASIAGGVTIVAGTGAVTYPAGWSGTTTVTASAAGCNGPRTAAHTVTITPTVTINAFSPATSTRCQGAGSVTYTTTANNSTGITYSLDATSIANGVTIVAGTGAVTYPAAWNGTTTITASAAGCNGPVTTTHVVTITPTVTVNAFSPATSTRCQGAGSVTYTTTANNSTGITYSLDAASIAGGVTIVAGTGAVTYPAAWNGTTTITASAAGCNGPATTTHVVTVYPLPSVTSVTKTDVTVCAGSDGTITITATGFAPLTYSINGGTTFFSNGGLFSGLSNGIYDVVVKNGYGCTVSGGSISVFDGGAPAAPVAGTNATYCTGASLSNLTATASAGGTLNWYSNPGLTTLIGTGTTLAPFNTIGTSNYYVTETVAGCVSAASIVTIVINPSVTINAFSPATSTRCQGAGSLTYTTTANNSTGLTYSIDAASVTGGVTIVAGTGVVTYPAGWSGTTTITASAAGCNGPVTTTHVVTITPTVTINAFSPATSTRCQGAGSVTYTTTANNSTGITYSLDAASLAAGNTINSTTGAVTYVSGWSGSTTITASAAGCNGPVSTTHVVTITPTVTINAFSPATSTRCQGTGSVTYTTTGTNTTGITYSLDAASIAGGVTIVAGTGAVTYPAGWSGTTTITASAAGCNGPATTTHDVTITPTVTVNAFSPATSTRCQGAGVVTYSTTGNNSTGVTYSLDAASLAGGNTINSATGDVTYAAGWSGTTTITASAAGCNGPAITTHVVTITPTVTINAFSPATSTRCQGAGTVNYSTTGTNTTGITYSLDAISSGAGNTINPSTGAVTYTAGWNGTTTITASASGCNGPVTTTHVVTITPSVVINAYSPLTSSRCQASENVTYQTTAVNSTGLTYSLDAASLAGGNTINTTTGEVTYSAGWSGTSIITASAAGCNGPVTTFHTVTTNPLPSATATSTGIMCNGGTAPVLVSGSGGTSPYNGAGIYNQLAGTYNYVITDANGCTASASITLTEPAVLAASSTSTPVLCYGGTSTVTISATGGTLPYSGIGTYTHPSGTYNYTVTDNNGCISNTSVTITEPTQVLTSVSTTFAGCGLSDGTATVTASGGTGTLTYQWSPSGGTNSTATGLPAGSYTVVTQDANGCSVTNNVNISNSGAPVVTYTTTNVLCHGDSTGAIDISVTGGTGSLTYNWNSGQFVTEDLVDMPAGSYSYNVTDAANCQATGMIDITEPDTMIATTTHLPVLCYGGTTQISVYASGGTGILSGTGNFTVPAGTYNYIITDEVGCTTSTSVTVTDPALLVAASTSTAVMCHGGTADVTVTATGGSGVYTGTGTFTVTAGTYAYEVRDLNGCIDTTYITVSEPDSLIASSSSTAILCYGDSAIVTVSAIGGTGNYTGTGSFTVASGTYNYTVTDDNNCTSITTITVTDPAEITSSVTTTTAGCGLSDGTATVTATGGTGTLTYQWSPSGGTGSTATGLAAGSYTVQISDDNGCTHIDYADISNSGAPSTSTTQVDVLCNGFSTGSVDLTITGGTGSYTVDWNSGSYTTEDLTSVPAGIYNYVVTDSVNCQSSGTVTINEPLAIVTVVTGLTPPLCSSSSDGEAIVNVSGGTIPYSFEWSDTPATIDDTISTLLGGAMYYVTVTDNNGCTAIDSASVTAPLPLAVSDTITQATCGGSDGEIAIYPAGGTAPYSYLWSNFLTTQSISGLSAGTYLVTVTDNNNCSITGSYTIINMNAGNVQVTSVSGIQCYGDSTGSITVNVIGGTSDFTFVWSTGDTIVSPLSSNTLSGLTVGSYMVTVTDANGCVSDTAATVSGPTAGIVSNVSIQDVSCYGMSDGVLIGSATGGTSPFTYNWSNSMIGSTLTNLPAGNYSLTVSDANGCTSIDSNIVIIEPEILRVFTSFESPACGGDSTATGTVNATGGTTPYTYAWSNQQTTQTISNIPAGQYVVTVTDDHGCTGVSVMVITQPSPIVVTYETGTDPTTNAGYIDITVTGGGLPYTYLWSNNEVTEDINNLTGGWYTYVIIDDNTCQISDSIFVELELGIPNTITPNNDGFNDDFFIINIEAYEDVDIQIYSQWNELLYQFTGTGVEYNQTGVRFNGLFGGRILPMGAYLYIITINKEETHTGALLIKY